MPKSGNICGKLLTRKLRSFDANFERLQDANTIYALKTYQESRKEVLAVDGVCGPATWKDLIAI